MVKVLPRVVVTCPTFEPGFRGGGPVKSVSQIIDSAPSDLDVVLITSDRDLGVSEPYPALSGRWIRRATASVFYLSRRNPVQWIRLIVELRKHPIKLLYVNSLWEPYFSITPIALSLLRVLPAEQLLIAPRGELSQAALSIKARKKRLFLRLWRPVLERLNPVWHASTGSEASDISACFPGSNIIVCSDRTHVVNVASAHAEGAQGRPVRFISVGRISPIKNLHVAIGGLRVAGGLRRLRHSSGRSKMTSTGRNASRRLLPFRPRSRSAIEASWPRPTWWTRSRSTTPSSFPHSARTSAMSWPRVWPQPVRSSAPIARPGQPCWPAVEDE